MSKEARAPFVADGREDSDNWFLSLSKIMGRKVVDIEVTVTTEFGDPTIQMYAVVFDDGTRLNCEGEHDIPYLTDGYGDKKGTIPDLTELRED